MDPLVDEILIGAYDLHVHASPDIVDRLMGVLDLKREATKAGMKGILIKSHVFETASITRVANEIDSGTQLFGSIALNYTVGGLNPYAVEAAVKLGVREVFLPTYSSKNHLSIFRHEERIFPYPLPEGTEGISILNQNSLKKEVYDIMDIISSHGVVLGTGHISPLESKKLIEESTDRGVKILITHPLSALIRMPLELLKELAGKKNVWAEFTYLSCTPTIKPYISYAELAKAIRLIGVDNTVLSTDLGQPYNPSPIDGMRDLVQGLLKEGISRTDLVRILQENPKILLGIS